MPKQSLYKILELNDGVSIAEIKKAYRRLSAKYHPDVNQGKKSFTEKFIQINNAYKVLSNPTKKAEYDRLRSNAHKQQQASQQQKTPNSGRRSYESYDSQESETDDNWRSLKNQHPVILMIIIYIAIAILLLCLILPSNNKKKTNTNIWKQKNSITKGGIMDEQLAAKINDIMNDKAKKEYESVDYPRVISHNKDISQLWLYNVELTGSETILSFMYSDQDKKPINVNNNFQLECRISENNTLLIKQYKLLRVENKSRITQAFIFVDTDKLFFFQLIFDATPNVLRYFNLIESGDDGKPSHSFGIDLNHKDEQTQNKFKEIEMESYTNSLN